MGNRLETRMCVCVCVCVTIAWTNDYSQLHFPPRRRAEHVAILSGPHDSSGSIDTAERLASMHCSFLSNDKWRNSALQSSSFRQFPRDIAYFSLLYFPRLFHLLFLFLLVSFFLSFFNNIPRVSLAESRFICHAKFLRES